MQALARDGLTEDEVRSAITAASVAPLWGADLLDLDGAVIDDLRGSTVPSVTVPDLLACKVSRNINATIHGLIDLTVSRPLDWPNVRIRPWQEIDGARFYLGLFGLETPQQKAADGTYVVSGYDMLASLRTGIGDSRTVAWDGSAHVPTSYLAAARQAIADADIPGSAAIIASDADDVLTESPLVWAASIAAPATWLRCVNDLLQAVGYRGLYADELGRYVSQPYRAPSERPSEWLFHTGTGGDQATDVVDVQRQAQTDARNPVNWWRFIRRDMAARPTEGAGLYTVDRTDGDRRVPFVAVYDVASQAALQLLGDNQVVRDTTRSTTVTISTTPMPQLGHADIVTYRDADLGIDGRAQITAWTQDLAASKCELTLGVL